MRVEKAIMYKKKTPLHVETQLFDFFNLFIL